VAASFLLAGCGTATLDRQQAHEEARTCASLVERVEARALARARLLEPEPPKEDLDPRVLASDPEVFYAELAQRLAALTFGPDERPVPVSAAARLVGRCRSVTG
jgi:hypothetical protein